MNDLMKRVTGVVGGLPYSPVQYCILAACSALAWAFCLELTILILYTFRRWSGLYFWSLLISAWGCAFHAIGFVEKFLTSTPSAAFLVFIEIGWAAMVSGQAFVLYSRLHLVIRKRQTLRFVLIMIIVDGICLHTPTIVLTIGSNSSNGESWAYHFNIMERIQLALFCVQEFIISTIYIYCTVRLLRSICHSRTREVMIELIVINAVCLSMDVVLIGLEYSNSYVGETSTKAMIYAIKLKLEFAVLNQLMKLTSRSGLTEGMQWAQGAATNNGTARSHSHDHSELRNRSLVNENELESIPAAVRLKSNRPQGCVFRNSFTGKYRKGSDASPVFNSTGGISRTRHIEITSEPRNGSLEHAGSHPTQRAQDPFPSDISRKRGDEEEASDEQSPRARESQENILRNGCSPKELKGWEKKF